MNEMVPSEALSEPVSGDLVDVDLPRLTDKQQAYVEARLSGLNIVDSFRAAYQPKDWAPSAEWTGASKVENNAQVVVWMKYARLVGMERTACHLTEHMGELSRLKYTAELAGNMGAAVQAEIWRGKAAGHYDRKASDLPVQREKDVRGKLAAIALTDPTLAEQLAYLVGVDMDDLTEGE